MKRGQVRRCDFLRLDRAGPVAILTRDWAIRYPNAVTVAPVASTARHVRSGRRLCDGNGMGAPCTANRDRIATVAKAHGGECIALLSASRLEEPQSAIVFALGPDERESG